MIKQRNTNIYPSLILLLLTGFVLFLVWSAFQAAGLGSRVTDKDYYSKGLKYNSTMVEKRAAVVLGWQLATRLEGRLIEFCLTDRKGGKIDHAVGSLYLPIPGGEENIHLPLQEATPGCYQINLADNIRGAIQAHLELEREGTRLNRQLLLNLW